jgi:signal transduction histidine kinase
MGTLIDDLLSLSRLTRSNIKPSQVDVSALALEVGNEFRQAQPEHDVLFIVQPNVSTVADPAFLKIALVNLIGNAWKFSSHTKSPKIEVGIEDTGEFFIKDNGAGFDQKYADKLFSPFQRLHSAEEFPGTGIGLAIVQRIIRRHGGDIRAHGSPGKGAVFHFSIGTELFTSRKEIKHKK